MNAQKLFTLEFFIAIGISSWGAIKQGYMPWPPTIVGSALAMAILSMLEAVSPELSVLLGAGFLLALLVGQMQGAEGAIAQTFAALPQNSGYDVLQIGSSSGASSAQPDNSGE